MLSITRSVNLGTLHSIAHRKEAHKSSRKSEKAIFHLFLLERFIFLLEIYFSVGNLFLDPNLFEVNFTHAINYE